MTRPLRAGISLLLTLASCASMRGAQPPQEALRQHELTVRYGRSHLDSDFQPFDKGAGGAIEYSYGRPRSPWRFFGGVSQTSDDVRIDQTFTMGSGATFEAPVRFQARIKEIYGGVRHEWTVAQGWVRPYLGGALSYAFASIESSPPSPFIDTGDPNNSIFPPAGVDDSDESVGASAQAGVAFPIGDGFRVSLDWRWLFLPELDLFGQSRNGNYQFLGFSFGWRF